MRTNPAPKTGTCQYCQHTGPHAEFVLFNPAAAGNLACRDLKACALRQAAAAGWMPDLDRMTAAARAGCAHPAGATGSCGCPWTLADIIEAAYDMDFDSAALLASALWERPAP